METQRRKVSPAPFVLIGAILGVPLSYYLQGDKVKAVYSPTKYIEHLPDLVESAAKDILPPIILTVVLGAMFGWVLSLLINRR